MNWKLLDSSSEIITGIINKWQRLIDMHAKELDYHDFIKRHANLFLVDGLDSHFVISKLKLGSDYELDFAVPYDEGSRGLTWELIEIEKPQDVPYTKSGAPSMFLNRATQQIRDWKRWIQSNRSLAMRMFSTLGVRVSRLPNFTFTVIIGTRENSQRWLQERNQYADENCIQIRSYDYLTDRLKKRMYFDRTFIASAEWEQVDERLTEKLANPFLMAFTDSEWKDLINELGPHGSHFTAAACKLLVERGNYNSDLMKKIRTLRAGVASDEYK